MKHGNNKNGKTSKKQLVLFSILLALLPIKCVVDEVHKHQQQTAKIERETKREIERIKNTDYAASDKKSNRQLIERQFSAWNGSHYKLEKSIKAQLKNPDSYQHVSTKYWQVDDGVVVSSTYRATNSLNALITEIAKAKYSFDGKLIGLVEIL